MTAVEAVRWSGADRRTRRTLVDALARAFDDDPVFRHLYPRPVVRRRALTALLGRSLADALQHGEVWAVHRGAEPRGAAIWLPPGGYPLGVLRELRYVAAGAPGALRSWRQLPDGLRVLRTMERTHPLDEHWYLAVLGVDPPLQGQGAGRAAVAPVLERCDEDGRPAYLETATTANVAWYSRLGFAVTEEHHIGPSRLTLWSMWREPRS